MIKFHICLVIFDYWLTNVLLVWGGWWCTVSISKRVWESQVTPRLTHNISIFLESLCCLPIQVLQTRQLLKAWGGLSGWGTVREGRQISGLKQQLNIKISSSAQTAQLYYSTRHPTAKPARSFKLTEGNVVVLHLISAINKTLHPHFRLHFRLT